MNTNQNNSLNQNEGEGSRTAAREYEAGLKSTVKSGKVDALAEEAKEALEGPDGASLRQAEKAGKQGKKLAS